MPRVSRSGSKKYTSLSLWLDLCAGGTFFVLLFVDCLLVARESQDRGEARTAADSGAGSGFYITGVPYDLCIRDPI